MEDINHYIGEIMFGLAGTFLAAGISAYKSLMGRIKKLEEKQIEQEGKITLNTALDNARHENK